MRVFRDQIRFASGCEPACEPNSALMTSYPRLPLRFRLSLSCFPTEPRPTHPMHVLSYTRPHEVTVPQLVPPTPSRRVAYGRLPRRIPDGQHSFISSIVTLRAHTRNKMNTAYFVTPPTRLFYPLLPPSFDRPRIGTAHADFKQLTAQRKPISQICGSIRMSYDDWGAYALVHRDHRKITDALLTDLGARFLPLDHDGPRVDPVDAALACERGGWDIALGNPLVDAADAMATQIAHRHGQLDHASPKRTRRWASSRQALHRCNLLR